MLLPLHLRTRTKDLNPAPRCVFSYTNQLVRLTVPEYFYPFRLNESHPVPPYYIIHSIELPSRPFLKNSSRPRRTGLEPKFSVRGKKSEGHGAWGMGHGAWGIGHGAWGMGHRAWGIGHGASGIGHRASGIGHRASGIGHG
jgi:hypothetical protein